MFYNYFQTKKDEIQLPQFTVKALRQVEYKFLEGFLLTWVHMSEIDQ